MALKMVKGSIDRMFDKNLQDLVRGIRNHKEDEVSRAEPQPGAWARLAVASSTSLPLASCLLESLGSAQLPSASVSPQQFLSS